MSVSLVPRVKCSRRLLDIVWINAPPESILNQKSVVPVIHNVWPAMAATLIIVWAVKELSSTFLILIYVLLSVQMGLSESRDSVFVSSLIILACY